MVQYSQQPPPTGTLQFLAIQTVASPILVANPAFAATSDESVSGGDGVDEVFDDTIIKNFPQPLPNPKWTLDKLKQEVLVSVPTVLQFVIKRGLIKEKKACPTCSEPMRIIPDKSRPEGVKYRCKKGGREPHDVSRSIREATWFENARLTFDKSVLLTYMWTQRYSQQQVMHELAISKKTCVEWFYFHREAVELIVMRHSQPIGGPGVIVEIDESKFGKRKHNKGRHVEGQWVFGGVERGTKGSKVFMVPVERRDSATLIPLIKKWILPETTIISDCWRAYDVLKEEDFVHLKVNHKLHFKDPETGAHTNTIEGSWAHAKRGLPKSGLKKPFLSGYLAEYIWRKHCRQNKLDLFEEFLRAIAQIYENSDEDLGEVDESRSEKS
jgi:transposase-like protein/predicted RNA-binding Zn-ribbon protein involved in translation (DUF1610 family)